MTDRTVVRFMQAAEAFEGKSDRVSDLPVSILYALAAPSTPEPIRAAFMRAAETLGGKEAIVAYLPVEAICEISTKYHHPPQDAPVHEAQALSGPWQATARVDALHKD